MYWSKETTPINVSVQNRQMLHLSILPTNLAVKETSSLVVFCCCCDDYTGSAESFGKQALSEHKIEANNINS